MNIKIADKVFRLLLILTFVLGTVWVPNTNAGAQHDPNPTFNVIASSTNRYGRSDWVEGWDWTIGGGQVSVSVDDPGTPASPDASKVDIEVVACAFDPSFGCFSTDFSGIHDIQAGDLVTVTQGATTKTHEVLAVGITDIDPSTDIVSGVADPYSLIQVMTWDDVSSASREVIADEFGAWSTDFTDSDPATGDFDIVGGNHASASRNDVDGDTSMFGDGVLKPNIHGSAQYDWVRAMEWPSGAEVHLTINGQDFGSVIMQEPQSEWDSTSVTFHNLGGYDIQTGDILTVTDGVQEKSLIVSSFEVTGIDTNTNIVSGVGIPGAQAYVSVSYDGDDVWRGITPEDITGAWEMDFSDVFDIQSGFEGSAQERDDDGDSTWYEWRVPNPTLGINSDGVWGIDWILGTSVTLSVDDPANGTGVDYTATETVQMYDFPNPTAVFHLPSDFQIQPGFELTMTDGTTSKTHTAMYFDISNVDVAADIVSGVTDAGSQVQVWMSKGARTVTAASDGSWIADFKIPGDPPNEDDIVDILPGDFVMATVYDIDGDSTGEWANASAPRFHVQLTQNNVEGYDWPLGASVTITIDTDNDGTPEFTSNSQTVVQAEWDPNSTVVRFDDMGGIDLAAGMGVTMTDGTTIKTHTVTVLTLTSVDPITDQVAGTAAPNSYMEVGHLCDQNGCAIRRITADVYGYWVADFSAPGAGTDPDEQRLFDIKPGMGNEVRQPDEDGDHTDIDWNVINPRLEVLEYADRIALIDWPAGQTVHVSIGDVSSPDYEQDFTPSQDQSYYEFFTTYDIKTGDIVTASNGTVIKTLEVAVLRATEIDRYNGIVRGVAAPNSQFDVDVSGDHFDVMPVQYTVSVDSNGEWSADYSDIPGSLLPWTWFIGGWMRQSDTDGDVTLANWHNHWSVLYVLMNEAKLWAFDWPLGATLTFMVDDPTTNQPIDFTQQAQTTPLPWLDHGSAFISVEGSFKLQPGMVVTVTDGITTKSTIIQDIGFDLIDAANNTIRGHAPANASLDINIQKDYVSQRYITADANGEWIVDYNTPDVAGRTLDLEPSDQIQGLYMRDAEFDSTVVNSYVPNPAFGARPSDERVEGWQWQLGATVTIEIDDPATTETVDYTGQTDVYLPEWNPNETRFDLNFNGEYDLKPGDTVKVTDGFTTKTHIVTNFALDEINPGTDMVFGHTSPNSQINVWACDNTKCVNREETANQSGNWQSNFSIPGNLDWEQDTINIQAGTWVDSSQNDEDGDGTFSGRNAGSTITGNAYLIQIAPENVVAGVMIEACNTDNFCRTGLTDGNGNYWISGLPSGTYNLRAIPPGTNLPGSLGPVDISYDEILYGQDITVPAPPLPPPPDAIEPAHTGGGTIAVFWMDDLTLTANGCSGGTASFKLTALEDGYTINGVMTETSIGSGIYKAAIPSLYPHHGVTEIVYTVSCPNGDTVETPFFIYIDPSGVVKNTFGNPIADATVTLLYADNPDGPFTEVPDGSVQMSPSNRDNPDTTNANGEFGWDVVAGFYKVRAEKAGCFSPTDPAQTFVESAVLTIPPPVTDLELILECPSLPPSASAGGPYSINEGDTVTLDASASSDPEAGALTYEWDLDYDGQYDDATGITTPKTFTDNGSFTIGLRVTDPDNLSATDTAEVTVANVSPVVTIQQASANNLGSLTGNGSFVDPGADAWTATVDYGDNTGTENLTLNPEKSFVLSHAYPARNGTYTVTVCVSDDDGGSNCNQTQVTVKYNRPPVAEADGPYFGNEGTNITLDASHSTDPDRNILRYEWDLDNDGQFDDATSKKPKFKAIDNGTFTVRVLVTDAGGLSSVDSSTVTVKNLPPVITSLSVNNLARVGVNVNANVAFKDAGVNDTFTATWKWGDGTSTSGVINGYTATGSHAYAKPGIYIVTITIKDKDGGATSYFSIVIILPKK